MNSNAHEEPGASKKGRKELINYLTNEVGGEVEFAWKTKLFFLKGQFKTEEMGKVIKELSEARFL